MRIGIDAQFAAYELRGIGKYIVHLVDGLVRADRKNSYVIYGPRRVFADASVRPNALVREPGNLPYPVWEQMVLPRWAAHDGVELLHCPANTAPLALSRAARLVVSIHDVMYLLPRSVLPPVTTARQRLGNLYRRVVVPRVARRADRVIAMAEFSRNQIVEWLGVAPSVVRVTYEGIEPRFFQPGPARPPASLFPGGRFEDHYILALGARDPRKNTAAIIQTYAGLRREQAIREKLVIVGVRDWRSSSFHRLAAELGVADDVFFTEYVPEETMVSLYSSARCLLYPSLFEGFGLPPLEAMACGTPVITSNVASIPELVGDAALLVNPTSPDSIRDALLRLLRDSTLRRTLIERGRARAAYFQWPLIIQRTLAVYDELAEGKQTEPAWRGACHRT